MSKLVVLACMFGCVYPPGTTKWWLKDQDQLLARRAAFDLNCDAAQIQVVPLGQEDFKYKAVGVKGCGETATYLWNDGSSTWVQNRTSAVKAER
jgi:hypothetical protein